MGKSTIYLDMANAKADILIVNKLTNHIKEDEKKAKHEYDILFFLVSTLLES